jgi:hypothetical protein
MKPRFFNYWLAHSCLISVCGSILTAIILLTRFYYNEGIFSLNAIYLILALLLYIPASLIGFFVGVFVVWRMIVGNIVSILHGAPLQPGDTVCILSGKHKGEITKVNQAWESRGQVVVNFSTESKTYLDDVFCNIAVFKIARNKLQNDLHLFTYDMFIIITIVLGLGSLAYVRNSLGLDEQDFHMRYSFGVDLSFFLELSLIVAIVYGIKKRIDVNPYIQLRKKSVEEFQRILEDTEYYPWHYKAKKILEKKIRIQERNIKTKKT